MVDKVTLEKLKMVAEKRGGKCLAPAFLGRLEKHTFKCKRDHTWETTAASVINGSWCKLCYHQDRKKYTIEDFQKLAANKGGECLSIEYKNHESKLLLRCSNNHIWKASVASLVKGQWCAQCEYERRRKYSVESLRSIAHERGGNCLSQEYISPQTHYSWRCRNGHVWKNTMQGAKEVWCKECNLIERKRQSLAKLSQIAESKGGLLISKEFTTLANKYQWKCDKNHMWKASGASIIQGGSWCPICYETTASKKRESKIEKIKKIITDKHGLLLDYSTKDGITFYKVMCANKHIWTTRLGTLLKGSWCQKCSVDRTRLPIQKAVELAKQNRGYCLSRKYKNSQTKLKWKCEKGHTWYAPLDTIKNQKSWCKICAYEHVGDSRKIGIDKMHEVAHAKGGVCLSSEYTSIRKKLQWKCKNGHIWWAEPFGILNGQWCPECARGRSERACQLVFEVLFETHFAKCRPDWLLYENKRRLELDGYNKELALAFEYNGEQHYKSGRLFSKNISFERRKQLDEYKLYACKKNGTSLIIVPYTVNYESLPEYIYTQCINVGIKPLKHFSAIDIYKLDIFSSNKLKEMQHIAESKGGKCLSSFYINSGTKMEWQCKYGHRWKAAPAHVKYGYWCPHCSHTAKKTLNQMVQLAKRYEGLCLSSQYINIHTKLNWQCKMGHIWEATPINIQAGHWCPVCTSNAHFTISKLQEIARTKNGKCLSETYALGKKLLWKCEKGHKWEEFVTPVLHKNKWCPCCLDKNS